MLRLTVNEGHLREALKQRFEAFVNERNAANQGGRESYSEHNCLINVPVRISSENPHVYERFRQEDKAPHIHLLLQFEHPSGFYEASLALPKNVGDRLIEQRYIEGLSFDEITADGRTAFVERVAESYVGKTVSNENITVRFH